MAVRFSGDAEVRITYKHARGVYEGTVRDPFFHWTGIAPPRSRFSRSPKTSEAYDDAAESLLLLADKASGNRLLFQKEGGRVKVRRLFQSPCPIGRLPRLGDYSRSTLHRKRKKRVR